MKAVQLQQSGGWDSLRCDEAPIPAPKAGQVLVRVAAAAVTPTEFDWYPTFHTPEGAARPFPIILGHEFSGMIVAVGPDCTGVHVGQAVYGLNDWFANGAQAEYCVTVPANIAPKPATIDNAHASAVPISALTAWQALIDRAQLASGQRVLIHGAAGGVGSMAVQLAVLRRASVIATTSAKHAALVASLGAADVIDYHTTSFETVVRDVDVVLDTVGGETRDRSWNVLRPGGRLITIAADAEGMQEQRVRDAYFIVEPNRAQLVEIAALIDAGAIKPLVGGVFPMEQFREAYQQKPAYGKHVLRIVEE
jgi:NADPH:quinone reductase-like Zn-dependent oxidoreductase